MGGVPALFPSCHVFGFTIYELRFTIYEAFGVVEEFGPGYVLGCHVVGCPRGCCRSSPDFRLLILATWYSISPIPGTLYMVLGTLLDSWIFASNFPTLVGQVLSMTDTSYLVLGTLSLRVLAIYRTPISLRCLRGGFHAPEPALFGWFSRRFCWL